MKRTLISGLFLSGALLASGSVLADDLCSTNLTKIHSDMATVGASNPTLAKTLKSGIDKAEAARKAGKTDECITESQKVLTQLDKSTKKGGGAGN